MKLLFVIVAIVALSETAFGGSIHGQSRKAFPVIKPKADCRGYPDILTMISELMIKIQDEIIEAAEAAIIDIGETEDFPQAIKDMVDNSFFNLVGHFNIFFFLSLDYPFKCTDYPEIFQAWATHCEISLHQAAGDLASLAYLKSPAHYDLVLADMETRIIKIKAEMLEIVDIITECINDWCEDK